MAMESSTHDADLARRAAAAVNLERLVDTALRLIAVPSPTGQAGGAADTLADILRADGFAVERPVAGHPVAPAVAVRFPGRAPGRVLQFDGHLDTVHLPFVPPARTATQLRGSGSSDMKAGVAAAVEALRAVRDAGGLPAGGLLLTAHDLHESPWGDGRQLEALIAEGYCGDGVLIPEYFNSNVSVIGRGGLIWSVDVSRPGPPIHEVMRPKEPSVIAAAADLVSRLTELDRQVGKRSDPRAGSESVFIGKVQAGTIYNEFPQVCRLEGTRRWLPGTTRAEVERELSAVFDQTARESGTSVKAKFSPMRGAFRLDPADPLVSTFQAVYTRETGAPLPEGGKPFVDDGNTFCETRGTPAITHGPNAGGAHTLEEWVSIDDLVRVAKLYAQVAVEYCGVSGE